MSDMMQQQYAYFYFLIRIEEFHWQQSKKTTDSDNFVWSCNKLSRILEGLENSPKIWRVVQRTHNILFNIAVQGTAHKTGEPMA